VTEQVQLHRVRCSTVTPGPAACAVMQARRGASMREAAAASAHGRGTGFTIPYPWRARTCWRGRSACWRRWRRRPRSWPTSSAMRGAPRCAPTHVTAWYRAENGVPRASPFLCMFVTTCLLRVQRDRGGATFPRRQGRYAAPWLDSGRRGRAGVPRRRRRRADRGGRDPQHGLPAGVQPPWVPEAHARRPVFAAGASSDASFCTSRVYVCKSLSCVSSMA